MSTVWINAIYNFRCQKMFCFFFYNNIHAANNCWQQRQWWALGVTHSKHKRSKNKKIAFLAKTFLFLILCFFDLLIFHHHNIKRKTYTHRCIIYIHTQIVMNKKKYNTVYVRVTHKCIFIIENPCKKKIFSFDIIRALYPTI